MSSSEIRLRYLHDGFCGLDEWQPWLFILVELKTVFILIAS